MRAGAVRFDFATLIAEGRSVFFGNQDGLTDFFEGSSVLFQKFIHREAVCAAHGILVSVLFGEKQSGVGTVGFGDNPEFVACRGAVAAE